MCPNYWFFWFYWFGISNFLFFFGFLWFSIILSTQMHVFLTFCKRYNEIIGFWWFVIKKPIILLDCMQKSYFDHCFCIWYNEIICFLMIFNQKTNYFVILCAKVILWSLLLMIYIWFPCKNPFKKKSNSILEPADDLEAVSFIESL